MLLPSKITCYKDSVLPLACHILKILSKNSSGLDVEDLFKKAKLKSTDEFIEGLLCLYALRKIELVEGGKIRLC